MEEAKDIATKLASNDEYIDRGYQAARAAAILPSAIDRITELEEALCEAEARALLNFQRFDAAVDAFCIDIDSARAWRSWDELSEDGRSSRREIARKMLHCEGRL